MALNFTFLTADQIWGDDVLIKKLAISKFFIYTLSRTK